MRLAACPKQIGAQCRRVSTAAAVQRVPTLEDASLETFRQAYADEKPILLPRQALSSLPAVKKWFSQTKQRSHINYSYLAKYGSVIVPLEFTDGTGFTRLQQPLSYFLECLAASTSEQVQAPSRYFTAYVPGARAIKRTTDRNTFFSPPVGPTSPKTQIYLAQAPITDLPRALRDDLPTPEILLKVGKGDIYDSSIWLGQPPTYTPLHRDPNPNLFVQLAGSKRVRLFRPQVGRGLLAKVQEVVGGDQNSAIRGEEMMQGAERAALDKEVWSAGSEHEQYALEAELNHGDALFIPKGWWHSVKSVGDGINGSVNWWFR